MSIWGTSLTDRLIKQIHDRMRDAHGLALYQGCEMDRDTVDELHDIQKWAADIIARSNQRNAA